MLWRIFLAGFVLFVGILLTTPAQGSYPYGSHYVNNDGYRVYAGDPYFWYGNYAHTRYWVYPTYYGGYYRPGYWRYSYSHTYKATPTYAGVTPADPSWRTKLLEIAANRDKSEGAIRRQAFEHAWFKEAVGLLGFQGNFKWEGYGMAPPYPAGGNYGQYQPHYGNLQLSSAGVNGNTVYGYSVNSIASVYGDANLSALYQQANRLAENAQKLAGQAQSDFSGLVGQEGANRAKVAEILAKSQAVREFLKGVEGNGGKVETRTFTFKVGPSANGGFDIQKLPVPGGADNAPPMPPAQDIRQLWGASASKCAQCHSPQSKDGGFDVTQYWNMPQEARARVVTRLLTNDENKRMPRTKDGKAGEKLSPDEIKLWLVQ